MYKKYASMRHSPWAGFLPRPPHRVWGARRRNGRHVMTVLRTQRHQSCTGNEECEVSIRCWHDLEATVQLHGVGREVHRGGTFAGHLRSWRLSESRCTWVRCVEVHGVDLGHAGRQVTEEASPHLWVHPFACGQETGDLSHTLTEPGFVFTCEWWVSVHSGCREKCKYIKMQTDCIDKLA